MGKKRDRDMIIGVGVAMAIVMFATYMILTMSQAPTEPKTITIKSDTQETAVALDVVATRMFASGTYPDICVIARRSGSTSTDYDSATGDNDFQFNPSDTIDVCVYEDENSGDGDADCGGTTTGESSYDYYPNCKFGISVRDLATSNGKIGDTAELVIETAREGSKPTFTGKYTPTGTIVTTGTSTGNLTLDAGSEKTVDMYLEIGSDVCYGTPMEHSGLDYVAIVTCEYNGTVIDDVVLKNDGASASDAWEETNDPEQFTLTYSDSKTVSYKVPFDICDVKNKNFDMLIEADDTNNPGDGQTITCTMYDVGFYIDATTGEWKFGVEDEDGNDVGQSSHGSWTVYIN
ncbi:hypothetical protein DRZ77_03245 [Candidatus Woesearchaeota archaeon]|nr:MAG: hypothetical protein DRZ77_03245 [Candidatus Woesearchaeota archaeon]